MNSIVEIFESFPEYIGVKDSLLVFKTKDMEFRTSLRELRITLENKQVRFHISPNDKDEIIKMTILDKKLLKFEGRDAKFFENETLAKTFAGITDKPYNMYKTCEECSYYNEEDMGYCYHKPYIERSCEFLKVKLTNDGEMKCKKESS